MAVAARYENAGPYEWPVGESGEGFGTVAFGTAPFGQGTASANGFGTQAFGTSTFGVGEGGEGSGGTYEGKMVPEPPPGKLYENDPAFSYESGATYEGGQYTRPEWGTYEYGKLYEDGGPYERSSTPGFVDGGGFMRGQAVMVARGGRLREGGGTMLGTATMTVVGRRLRSGAGGDMVGAGAMESLGVEVRGFVNGGGDMVATATMTAQGTVQHREDGGGAMVGTGEMTVHPNLIASGRGVMKGRGNVADVPDFGLRAAHADAEEVRITDGS